MILLLFIMLAVALIIAMVFIYYQRCRINETLHLLALQNQNIMLAIRAGNIAVWGYDVKQGHLYNIEGKVFPGENGATIEEAMAGVHPDDCDRFAKILQGVVNGEMPDETICVRFKNMYTGEWEYIEKEFAVIKSRTGEVETVIGTHKDVTKRVLESEKIDELLKKYQYLYNENQTILNSLPTGVSIYDKDGKMSYINQTLCDMVGIKDHDRFLDAGFFLWNSSVFNDESMREIAKGKNTTFHYQLNCNKLSEAYFTPADKILSVSCITSVVKNENGEIESYIFIHHDSTLQEEQEREMGDMSETLVRVIDASRFTVWEYLVKEQRFYSYQGHMCVPDGTAYEDTIVWHTPKSARLRDKVFHNLIAGISETEHVIFEQINPENKKITFFKCELVARKDAEGNVIKIYGIQNEITEEYNYQLELEESKLKTQLAIKISNMVQWEYDVDQRLFYTVNERWGDNVLTVDDYLRVTYPDDLQRARDIIAMMDAKRNEAFEFDVRFKFPTDQQWQYIKITGTPLKQDADGKIVKYTGFQRNNTQWHNLTKELEVSRNHAILGNQMLREIINRIPGILFIKDPNDDFRYLIANKVFCELWGKSENEIIGKTDFEITDYDQAVRFRKDDQRVVDTGEPFVFEEETNIGGDYHCWKTIKSPFITLNNTKLLIVTCADITEIRRTNIELQRAKIKAEESDKLKSAFLANMSHEIRTPLNSIVGFSGLLKDSDNEQDKEEYWNIINTNNELLLRLINDILDLSKIESGTVELKSVQFDMTEKFNEIYASLKLRNNNKDVKFICDNPYRQCLVQLDENRVTQIITNFVTNSFKFTPHGEIIMGYEYVNEGIKFYCKDTGIGIATDKMDKIFYRFSKLDDFAQGTGLGTAICKAIVDAYGGKIGATSVVNEGSTFWAWIPCKAQINQCIEEQISEIPTNLPENDQFTSMKILIAEDIESNYLLIRAMLKGFDITRAVNGVEAIKKLKEEHFDLVLMDMKMPVMGGIEATQEIRKFNKTVRIVALTANAFDSDKQAALDAGCNGFIAKPVCKTELFEMLHAK